MSMHKAVWKNLFLVICGGLLGFVLAVGFADKLSAKLSKISFFENSGLAGLKSPIVIHTKEEIYRRGDDDILNLADRATGRLARVLVREVDGFRNIGTAVYITGDGVLVTGLFNNTDKKELYIQNSKQELFLVQKKNDDPRSGISVLTTLEKNTQFVEFGNSSKLRSGERVIFTGLNSEGGVSVFPTFIKSPVHLSEVQEAGFFNRVLEVDISGGVEMGGALFGEKFEWLGLWNGTKVVSVQVVEDFVKKFLSENKQPTFPRIGLAYEQVSPQEARVYGKTAYAAQVVRVETGSPAWLSGIRVGDFLVGAQGKKVDKDFSWENVFLSLSPDAVVDFEVLRAGKILQIKLSPKTLTVK